MPTTLRILLDVVRFRLRKLEMGNLAAVGAIGLTLQLGAGDLGLRLLAAALLNAAVYLNNDYLDVSADLEAVGRDREAGTFLHTHMDAALRLQWVLAALLVLVGLAHAQQHGADLLIASLLGGAICVAYSVRLKHLAFADVAAMTAWGVAMPMLGFPFDSQLGWALAIQLGLFSSVFESMQVVRDRQRDAAQGIRTTAVVLGATRTLLQVRSLLVVCALYTAAVLHPAIGALPLAAALLPLGEGSAARDWNRIKALCGLSFLASCALIWSDGSTEGLWLQLRALG